MVLARSAYLRRWVSRGLVFQVCCLIRSCQRMLDPRTFRKCQGFGEVRLRSIQDGFWTVVNTRVVKLGGREVTGGKCLNWRGYHCVEIGLQEFLDHTHFSRPWTTPWHSRSAGQQGSHSGSASGRPRKPSGLYPCPWHLQKPSGRNSFLLDVKPWARNCYFQSCMLPCPNRIW